MPGKDLLQIEILAMGMAGVVASQIAGQPALATGSTSSILALTMLLATLLAAIALVVRPQHCAPPLVLTVIWLARAGWGLRDALSDAPDLTLWVSAAEAATIATAMLKVTMRHSTLSQAIEAPARTVASIMLLLFAYVHLLYPQAITQLIPAFFPARSMLPLMSGGVMAAASALLLTRRLARAASLIVATMFMAWVPLIHAPRLIADPTSTPEWQFAFMALCLAGGLVVIGRENQSGPDTASRRLAVQPS